MRLEPTSVLAGTSTKNDEGRTFPFDVLPPLAGVLQAQRALVEEVQRRLGAVIPWLWVRSDGSRICKIDEAWRAACKQAGYPGRLFHDFRRTAARNLVRAGVPEHHAMKLCGHKTAEIFRRYAIVNEADLRVGVTRLAALHGAAPQGAVGSAPAKRAKRR
jgi:integrase